MDFEWDEAKHEDNQRKHRIDFRTAVVEFDERDPDGEPRHNAIGLVDSRMLFVTYTMRGDVIRIISARGAEPHEKRKYHEV